MKEGDVTECFISWKLVKEGSDVELDIMFLVTVYKPAVSREEEAVDWI